MAAISLLSNIYPFGDTATVGTTWQEYTLPAEAKRATVTCEGEAGFCAFDSMGRGGAETPTDGGAVGTHRQPCPADALVEVVIPSGTRGTTSLFVARSSTSGLVSVLVEV